MAAPGCVANPVISPSRKPLLLASLLGLGLAAVFWVPTRFPPPLAWSDSYVFGFNNRLCEALFLLLAAVFWLSAKACRLEWLVQPMPERSLAEEMPARLLVGCLIATALLCGFETWLTFRAGGIGDGAYFLDRIHLIERGQVPYRDFEFVYGSFSLYASIFLGKLFACGSTAGFYILWWAETLCGVVLLWFGVRQLDLPASGKRIVFLLFFCLALLIVLAVTLNYTILRYSLPFFAVTALPHLDRGGSRGSRLQVGVAAVAAAVLMLGISPEEAMALAVATVLYLPLRSWALGRAWLLDTAVLAAILLAIFRFAAHRGVFGTMGRFGAGAFNLPLYPGLQVLFFFAAFLAFVLLHATGRVRDRAGSNLALVMIYAFGMLPGALGRADGIHILGYELPLLAGALLLSRARAGWWRVSVVYFVLAFFLIPIVVGFGLGQPTFSKALLLHLYGHGVPSSRMGRWADRYVTTKAVAELGPDVAAQKMTALRLAAEGNRLEPRDAFPGVSAVVMAPFAYLPNKLSNYQSPAIDEGYYMGLSNITVPSQIEDKIAEMRRHPERDLVVSPEGFDNCGTHGGNASAMRRLLLYPFVPEPKHAVYTFNPVCDYIHANYHWLYQPSTATFGYGVMRHN